MGEEQRHGSDSGHGEGFVATAVADGAPIGLAAAAAASIPTAAYSATIDEIPELAPQWKKLNLAEILRLPAAYVSVSQSKSLYDTGGAQSAESTVTAAASRLRSGGRRGP